MSARRAPIVRGMGLALSLALVGALPRPAFAAADTAPAPGKSDSDAPDKEAPDKDETLTFIFSGKLASGETYSGTLVAGPEGPEFEMKLSKGATCDADKIEPDKGLLRLPETACSDGRKLKLLFVPQTPSLLRVYGSLDEERFSAKGHALPADAPEPEKPSAAPPAKLMDKTK